MISAGKKKSPPSWDIPCMSNFNSYAYAKSGKWRPACSLLSDRGSYIMMHIRPLRALTLQKCFKIMNVFSCYIHLHNISSHDFHKKWSLTLEWVNVLTKRPERLKPLSSLSWRGQVKVPFSRFEVEHKNQEKQNLLWPAVLSILTCYIVEHSKWGVLVCILAVLHLKNTSHSDFV